MPVLLKPELINSWIMEPTACRELLKKIPPQLLATAEDNQTSLCEAAPWDSPSQGYFLLMLNSVIFWYMLLFGR